MSAQDITSLLSRVINPSRPSNLPEISRGIRSDVDFMYCTGSTDLETLQTGYGVAVINGTPLSLFVTLTGSVMGASPKLVAALSAAGFRGTALVIPHSDPTGFGHRHGLAPDYYDLTNMDENLTYAMLCFLCATILKKVTESNYTSWAAKKATGLSSMFSLRKDQSDSLCKIPFPYITQLRESFVDQYKVMEVLIDMFLAASYDDSLPKRVKMASNVLQLCDFNGMNHFKMIMSEIIGPQNSVMRLRSLENEMILFKEMINTMGSDSRSRYWGLTKSRPFLNSNGVSQNLFPYLYNVAVGMSSEPSMTNLKTNFNGDKELLRTMIEYGKSTVQVHGGSRKLFGIYGMTVFDPSLPDPLVQVTQRQKASPTPIPEF